MLSAIILTLTLAFTAFGQKAKWPPKTTWYTVQHRGWPYDWSWTDLPSSTSIIPYPKYYVELSRDRDQWVNQIMTRSLQGNVVGKTVTIKFTVTINKAGRWYFNGYQNPADYGTAPVRARLFMIGYDNLYAQVSAFTPNLPNLTQWSVKNILLPEQPGTYTGLTITSPLIAGEWTNVNGQTSQTGINICASNMKQIGLCLAGGNFYSVGVGQQEPNAVVTIESITIQ